MLFFSFDLTRFRSSDFFRFGDFFRSGGDFLGSGVFDRVLYLYDLGGSILSRKSTSRIRGGDGEGDLLYLSLRIVILAGLLSSGTKVLFTSGDFDR